MLMRGVEATLPFVSQGRPATRHDHRRRVPVPARARAGGLQGPGQAAHRRRLRARHRHAQVLGRQAARLHARPAALQEGDALGNRDRARVPRGVRGACCRTACGCGSRTRPGRPPTSSRSRRPPRATSGVITLHGRRRRAPGHARAQEPDACGSTRARTWPRSSGRRPRGDVDLRDGRGRPAAGRGGSAPPRPSACAASGSRSCSAPRASCRRRWRRGAAVARDRAGPGRGGGAAARQRAAAALRLRRARGACSRSRGRAATNARSGARDRSLLTPSRSRRAPPRRGASRATRFVATLDPATGRGARAPCSRAGWCSTSRGARAGPATRPSTPRPGALLLTRDPRIVDEAEGSELRAARSGSRTRTRARDGERQRAPQRSRARAAAARACCGARSRPSSSCREFEFDPQTRTRALPRERARRARARTRCGRRSITLDEPGAGQRRMSASGGTTSVLHPRRREGRHQGAGRGRGAQPRDAVYEEATNRIVYTGDVEIRQGDILTRSPEAIVLLTKDGETIDRLLAGEPVEVQQGVRRATGERGTYTPANETFVLMGEKVVLHGRRPQARGAHPDLRGGQR